MYKVFFNERKVFLVDDFLKYFQINDGLFYRYQNHEELKDLVNFYFKLTKIDTLFLFHYDIDELRNAFRSCFKNIDAAGGLVKNEKGEILVIFRRNKWDLPKGKVNKKESLQKTALREVSEECGINNIEIIQPLMSTYHTYMLDNRLILKKTHWFEMIYTGNQRPIPEKREGITKVKWFTRAKLDKILNNTYPLILDLLRYDNQISL